MQTKEVRYCKGCHKDMLFMDTKLRRTLVNGKAAYHFAIYMCKKGHHWNKTLEQVKANLVDQSDLNLFRFKFYHASQMQQHHKFMSIRKIFR